MERVGEHPVTPGPLAVRWLAYELEPPRAGATGRARVALENAGSATWRARGREGVRLAYHWLDPLGNPIVWDGTRAALPGPVAPGETIELDVSLAAPRPPGRYVLSLDLVEEHRFWFAEVGSQTLDVPVQVAPRIAERRLRAIVVGGPAADTAAALASQEEPLVERDGVATAYLVPGALPAPDWSRRLLDAHAEGWAAVGGAVDPLARRDRRRLAPWAPGGGRNPRFSRPLLLPSLLDGLEPGEHEGLPAYEGEDALFEGRAVVRLRPRSGRRRG
ncbi:MAG TPA: hypothetical protein VFB26_00375 [Gaiellaceae bacterium]|nr:hypothetical protein [Gaiellaceae bacterium]